MGYLGYPRLNFSGRFQSDVSTINNDRNHYDNNTFVPNDQLPQVSKPSPQMRGWWNPGGSAYFRFRDCTIKKITYKDGSTASVPAEDPLIGLEFNQIKDKVAGKMVDLDPDNQGVSQLWGFKMNLADPNGNNIFTSNYEVTGFYDIWVRYPASPGLPPR